MTAPRVLRLPVVGAKEEASEVTSFFFDRDDGFDFVPGQYVALKIEGVDDQRGPVRPFTLSSAPGDERLSITTRMTGSGFKRRLASLAADGGDPVQLRGPLGRFVLQEERPALMIAGGIGITPFRSMIRAAAGSERGEPITLLYSSSSPDGIVFRAELDRMAGERDSLRVVHTITGEGDDGWSGRRGRIDAELIREEAGALAHPVFYVCGPVSMVDDMIALLRDEIGVGADDLRFEKFTGY